MAKTLTITDEKVKAMAAQCPDAARVLRQGFPEAFTPQVNLSHLQKQGYYDAVGNYGNQRTMLEVNPAAVKKAFDLQTTPNRNLIEVRTGGEYANKAFYLNPQFAWTLTRDSSGSQVLVPTAQIS